MAIRRRFAGNKAFVHYFEESHASGALDEKTKQLMHLAVSLALKCEPCAIGTLDKLKKLGVSEEEIYETVELAGSVGAGTILAMADRAVAASDIGHKWWELARP